MKRYAKHDCGVESPYSEQILPPLPKNARFRRFLRRIYEFFIISVDNPHALHYFPDMRDLVKEGQRQVNAKCLIIHPFSKCRAYYEVFLAVFYIFNLIIIPPEMVFNIDERFIFYFRIVWWFEIFMMFVCGSANRIKGVLVMDFFKIAWYNFKSITFYCDLLCLIPLNRRGSYSAYTVCANLILLLKFFKIKLIFVYTKRTMTYFRLVSQKRMMIYHTCLAFFMINHWMACLHYLIPQIRYDLGYNSEAIWTNIEEISDKPWYIKYIHSIYRSTAFILGISLGKYMYLTYWEDVLLGLLSAFLGAIITAAVWVILLTNKLSANSLDIKYQEVINQLKEYMNHKQLSPYTKKRLLEYYEYKYQKKFFSESFFNAILTDSLKTEVNLHICKKLIMEASLFSELTSEQIMELVNHMQMEIYLPNDIIVKAGAHGDSMFFLASGTAAVLTISGKEVCHLEDGSHFGEISLLIKGQKRSASIVAVEVCEVYRLHRRYFDSCFAVDSPAYNKMLDAAMKRLRQTKDIEELQKRQMLADKLKDSL